MLFFVANGRWGIYWGTGIFIVATAVALPCYRWLEKRWPVMPLVGGFFVLVFGGLTIWLQDDTFIKLKPTIVNCLFGTILGGGLLLFGRPLLKPLFGTAFRLTDEGWRKLTLRWALFFFVLAAVNEVMWRWLPDRHLDRQQDVPELPRSRWSSLSCRCRCSSATGTAPTILSPGEADPQSSWGVSGSAPSRSAVGIFSAKEPIEKSSTPAATQTAAIVAPS